jgi:hypothetical protein
MSPPAYEPNVPPERGNSCYYTPLTVVGVRGALQQSITGTVSDLDCGHKDSKSIPSLTADKGKSVLRSEAAQSDFTILRLDI